MVYTVVYVPDDGAPSCYGQFSNRAAAEAFAEAIERGLDPERDPAGGGVGVAYPAAIQRKDEWLGFLA